MWTEFVQVFFMFVGAIALAVISIIKVGGYSVLTSTFREAGMPNETQYQSYKDGCDPATTANCTSCSEITPYYMNLFRPASDGEVPWPGLIGMTVSGVWYWCTDQVIVQRGLSAKNLSHAKAGCIFASFMKIAPLFLLVLPGMAARMLWPNQIGCSNPEYCKEVCGSPSGCTNLAYPYLVIRLMPVGATGLMVSVIVAALMSSLTSIFNSASTIFIIDIYKRFRRSATEMEQIVVGRVFVVFLVVVSVAWVPIIESSQNSELFQYIQSVTSFLSPPVCAVYVLALFWGRTNEQGAFWSLVVGLVIGLVRMILEFAIPAPACSSTEPDPRPFITKLHYLHFGIVLFAISAAVAIVVSLLTKRPEEKNLYRLTYSTIHSEEVREDIDGDGDDDNATLNAKTWIWILCCAKPEEPAAAENGNAVHSYNIEKEIDPEELARIHAQSAKDDPKWDWAVNLGGVLIIFIASFLWGYFA
ncbi:hypothetical protein TYRP_014656 [Tyrophagus putrescentiae]|nr:hypothetical protein TYRP_014656 [Tyrophagus putrescentiae]